MVHGNKSYVCSCMYRVCNLWTDYTLDGFSWLGTIYKIKIAIGDPKISCSEEPSAA